ncbi:MAG TPA: hypothetical protein VF424_13810 [Vicinamibacterales bacterium]
MSCLWQAPAIFVVFTWLSMPPGTLGNAGRQEALRRSMMPNSIASLSLYEPPGITPPAGSAPLPAPAPLVTPSPGVVPEEPVRDEKWWRARAAAARAALDRDQTLADAMQSHINSLRNDVVNRDDPAQQALLRERLASALAELDRLKQQIEADRQAILDIEVDARRKGIPAGWIRHDVISSGRSP